MICTQHVTCIGEKRNTYRVVVCKHEEKRLLGRPTHRWKDNINMTLTEIGWNWLPLPQDKGM
jgi:hypothetical protein